MRIRLTRPRSARLPQLAYTLVEVVIGVAIIGIAFVSLYAGMSSGFAVTQLSRENLRATQIILERMEGLRLFNWNQLCYSNMVPATFTNYYYQQGNSSQAKGVAYHGTMVVTNAALSPAASYSDGMRQIIVTVSWESGGVKRNRSMTTYSARNGLQNYVYSN